MGRPTTLTVAESIQINYTSIQSSAVPCLYPLFFCFAEKGKKGNCNHSGNRRQNRPLYDSPHLIVHGYRGHPMGMSDRGRPWHPTGSLNLVNRRPGCMHTSGQASFAQGRRARGYSVKLHPAPITAPVSVMYGSDSFRAASLPPILAQLSFSLVPDSATAHAPPSQEIDKHLLSFAHFQHTLS